MVASCEDANGGFSLGNPTNKAIASLFGYGSEGFRALKDQHGQILPCHKSIQLSFLGTEIAIQPGCACRKYAFKHSYAVECGNRLRVGVRAKNASVSGFACRPF